MATLYQISNRRHIAVSSIPGSPCYLVRECYQEPELPADWTTCGQDHYIEAGSDDAAAQAYVDQLLELGDGES